MAYGLVVPNASEIRMLQYLLNKTSVDTPILHLYSNDITPDEDSVIGDFTEIPVVCPPGTDVILDPNNWIFNTLDGVGIAEYPTQTYTVIGPVNIYGYYVTNNAQNFLLWAQRCFYAPVSITGTGTFSVTPRFSAKSLV